MNSGMLILLGVSLAGMVGCIAPHAGAGRDADASVAGLRAEIEQVRTAFVELQTDVRAGRDVVSNDKWTLRLLGLGVLLLGLSYPVGKLVWVMSGRLGRTARYMVAAARAGLRSGHRSRATELIPKP